MWQVLLIVLAICGVVSFGIVQLLKMLYTAYLAATPDTDHEPWYWNVELRAMAVLVGATTGAMFSYAGLNIILAIGVGLVGGILNTIIVRTVKAKIRGIKLGSEDAVTPEGPETPQDGGGK